MEHDKTGAGHIKCDLLGPGFEHLLMSLDDKVVFEELEELALLIDHCFISFARLRFTCEDPAWNLCTCFDVTHGSSLEV